MKGRGDQARAHRITIAGTGTIGSTLAWTLMLRRSALELLLWNRDEKRSRAKAFDLSHCRPRLPGAGVRAISLEESELSDIVVISAGVLPDSSGKRGDVLGDNIAIFRDLVPRLSSLSPGAVFIIVTNPVDAMAFAAHRLSGLGAPRIIGSGTLLDSLRLRAFCAEALGLEAGEVEVDVVGEHGDTMLPLWSRARVCGEPIEEYLEARGLELGQRQRLELLERTRRAGWEIRLAGEHSCYAIALSLTMIIDAILDGKPETLALSSLLSGEYGIAGIYMSLPSVLGRHGLVERKTWPLPETELSGLETSAAALRAQMELVDSLL